MDMNKGRLAQAITAVNHSKTYIRKPKGWQFYPALAIPKKKYNERTFETTYVYKQHVVVNVYLICALTQFWHNLYLMLLIIFDTFGKELHINGFKLKLLQVSFNPCMQFLKV